MCRPTTRGLTLDTDQWLKLEHVLELATGGDDSSINLIVEAVGEDNHATESLVALMDGAILGRNPTLMEIQYNQQLLTSLVKHIAEYIVRD
jgi:pantothenate kinase